MASMTDDRTKQWYIVHTYSGFENKVKESLEQRIQAYGLQDEIGEILIPTEDIVEKRGGRELFTSRPPRFSTMSSVGIRISPISSCRP